MHTIIAVLVPLHVAASQRSWVPSTTEGAALAVPESFLYQLGSKKLFTGLQRQFLEHSPRVALGDAYVYILLLSYVR